MKAAKKTKKKKKKRAIFVLIFRGNSAKTAFARRQFPGTGAIP